MNNDYNQTSKDSQIINAQNAIARQTNIAASERASVLDNENIIGVFILEQNKFVYNQELKVESQMNVALLKTSQGELIGIMKKEKESKYALIKEKGNKYIELIQHKLTENCFVDLGESKTKLGFIEYKQEKVPEGYQINYTTAKILWKIWWPSQSFHSTNKMQLNILVYTRGQWYPIKSIVVHEGILYIKTLVKDEITLAPSEKITWINKVEKEASEGERKERSKLHQSATVAKRYSSLQKMIAEEQPGNNLQLAENSSSAWEEERAEGERAERAIAERAERERAERERTERERTERAIAERAESKIEERAERDRKRDEIIRQIWDMVKSMKQMRIVHQNQIISLQRQQGEEFNNLREQMLELSKKVADMEMKSVMSLRETSTTTGNASEEQPQTVLAQGVVAEHPEEAKTNNEQDSASTMLLQNLINWLEKRS